MRVSLSQSCDHKKDHTPRIPSHHLHLQHSGFSWFVIIASLEPSVASHWAGTLYSFKIMDHPLHYEIEWITRSRGQKQPVLLLSTTGFCQGNCHSSTLMVSFTGFNCSIDGVHQALFQLRGIQTRRVLPIGKKQHVNLVYLREWGQMKRNNQLSILLQLI